MIAESTRDRKAERQAATRAEILAAAWDLARAHGVAGFALRDVALKIGMRPPSLYWYFPSKDAVYDAMFAQGSRQFLARLAAEAWPHQSRLLLRRIARVFVQFCCEDIARYQLLFQRTIPDFEPSAESYALAVQAYDQMRIALAGVGITRPAELDLWTALTSGLSAQQTANDPGGERWLRLSDQAADMFFDQVVHRTRPNRRHPDDPDAHAR